MFEHALTIRAATPRDSVALEWLARLDGHPHLRGHALVAERDGVPIAAIALSSGSVVADPFQTTAGVVHVLRQRRYRFMRQGRDAGMVRALLRRLAPQPVSVG